MYGSVKKKSVVTSFVGPGICPHINRCVYLYINKYMQYITICICACVHTYLSLYQSIQNKIKYTYIFIHTLYTCVFVWRRLNRYAALAFGKGTEITMLLFPYPIRMLK